MKGRESQGGHCSPEVQSVQRPGTQRMWLFGTAEWRLGGNGTELGERRFEVRDSRYSLTIRDLLVLLNALDLILGREGHD